MKKAVIIFFIIILLLSFFYFYYSQKPQGETIKFASWGSQSELQILTSAIDKFKKENPNISVEFVHIPQNYFQKIHLLFASNLEPDVIFMNNQNIKMYIKAGLLDDLSVFFPNADKLFYKQALDCFKDKDKLYAIPRDISNLVLYYNKNLFAKENIKIPQKLNTIQDLENLARKLTSKNVYGINFEEDSLFWIYFLASEGGGILSQDEKSLIINTQQSLNTLNKYSDFVNKYHIAPSKSEIGSMTTAQMFIKGKLAMYLGGRWMVPKFREAIDFDWDVMEFPSNNNYLYSDASGWAISKKSKNKNSAVKFIKYLSSKEISDEFTKYGLIIPARKDSTETMLSQDKINKPYNSVSFINTVLISNPTPINENYNIINEIVQEKAQIIFNEHKKAEDVFDTKTIMKLESLI